jgi:parvulin-like peptidyl-prolyl isomerase
MVVDRVAAVVNDEVITLSEVYALGADYIEDAVTSGGPEFRREAEHAVLERLIERQLVDQEIAALKIDVTDQDLDRAIDDLARRNGLDRDGLRQELQRQGMGWDEYRTELRSQLRDLKFQQGVLRPRITIADDELRDLWLRSGGGGAEEATVQGVVLAIPAGSDGAAVDAIRARAKEAMAKIDGGTAFADIAAEYDEGPYRRTGGQMGSFKRGELVPALDGPVFSAELGRATLVETPSAIFVLRVQSRQRVQTGFEEAKDQLTEQIFMSRMEEEKERWYEQARREAVVKVVLPGGDGRGPKSGE